GWNNGISEQRVSFCRSKDISDYLLEILRFRNIWLSEHWVCMSLRYGELMCVVQYVCVCVCVVQYVCVFLSLTTWPFEFMCVVQYVCVCGTICLCVPESNHVAVCTHCVPGLSL